MKPLPLEEDIFSNFERLSEEEKEEFLSVIEEKFDKDKRSKLDKIIKERDSEAFGVFMDSMSEEDLGQDGPEPMRSFCPTVGSLFLLIGTHPMMHVGQFVPIRRKLQKPIVM